MEGNHMANSRHLEILAQGISVWNRWRDEHPEIIPDLTKADLGGADLHGVNLHRADLSMADLAGVNFSGGDLTRADFRQADLSGADLSGADLRRASFIEANLHRANLTGANLSEAILFDANLSGVNLSNINLSNVHLKWANLSEARLLPIRVYLSEGEPAQALGVENSIHLLANIFGFEIEDLPAERGSWFKSWFLKTKEVLSREDVVERLQKLERSVELELLGTKQAIIDKNQAEAVATLLQALQSQTSAILQIGSLLIIKCTADGKAQIFSRTLTQKEMIFFERNQHLLCQPSNILQVLSDFNAHIDRDQEMPPRELNRSN
jgi:uncharacterized protein YjbI with pentapeptide repeats